MSADKNELKRQDIEKQLTQLKEQASAEANIIIDARKVAHEANTKMEAYAEPRVNAFEEAHTKYEDAKQNDNREQTDARRGERRDAFLEMKQLLKTTHEYTFEVTNYSNEINSNLHQASSAANNIASLLVRIKELFNDYRNISMLSTPDAFDLEARERVFEGAASSMETPMNDILLFAYKADLNLSAMERVSGKIAKAVQEEEGPAVNVKAVPSKNKELNESTSPKTKNNKALDKDMMAKHRVLAQAAKNTRAFALKQENAVLPFLKENFNTLSKEGFAKSTVGHALQAMIKTIDSAFVAKSPPPSPRSVAKAPALLTTYAPLKQFQENLSAFMKAHEEDMPADIKTNLNKLPELAEQSISNMKQDKFKTEVSDNRPKDDGHTSSSKYKH